MKVKQILLLTVPDANMGLLILRVFIGVVLMTHGFHKMFGLSGFTENVADMGLPFPQVMAFLIAFAESFGAFLLALGLLTRPMALLIVCAMGVAVFGAHGSGDVVQQELAWLYLVSAMMFMLKGAGKWSIDFLISSRKESSDS